MFTLTLSPAFRPRLRGLLGCGLLVIAQQISALGTPTENNGLRVLPAPSHVVIDGKIDDWDLSAGIFCCDNVEDQRDHFAVWLHAMYDENNLYILARFTDETPLNNPGQTIADAGWNGDCLQFRVITAPDTPQERTSHWNCWHGRDGADVIQGSYGKIGEKLLPTEPPVKDAKMQGGQQAFTINPDGKGYVQEIALPWKFLTADGKAPAPGSDFRLTFEPNFTIGIKGRLTIKDLFQANKRPDRVFTFQAWPCWGTATLQPKNGPVTPQPVRLADAREFPVKMKDGIPVVDWSGVTAEASLPGFKTLHFTMPEDGFISLNINAADGTVVRQLLNASAYTKGPHEVQWDGLTTPNAHLAGDPVPAGTYTWSALFHKDIGVKLRGWAHNAGTAPWENGVTTNWGGDEGNPTAAAADDAHVYLGWGCAEGGWPFLACDRDGVIQWKNRHGGISGVKAIAAADGVVYVLGGGYGEAAEGGTLYKLNAKNGDFITWNGSDQVDVDVKALSTGLPGAPTKAQAIAAGQGKLYLSFTSAGKILVLDAKDGKLLQTLDLPTPGAMQVDGNGALWVLSGDSVLRMALGQPAQTVIADLRNPTALAFDKEGHLYVGLGDPNNQVKMFDTEGKLLHTIGRPGGRALLGKWTPEGMRFIAGLAVAADDRLWVAENDGYPRRMSAWDTKTGKLWKEFFGSTDYGALGGAIDPLDPNVMVGMGCEWKLDPVTGLSSCVSVITRDGMAASRFGVGKNGRVYLATSPEWNKVATTSIYERPGDGDYKLRGRFHIDTDPQTQSATTRYWADANGDGQEQPDEVTTAAGKFSANGWYLAFTPDLTFYSGHEQFKCIGFTAAGAPRYDLSHPVEMPHADEQGGLGSADGSLVIYNGHYAADRSTFNVYNIASGKKLWSYPNDFVGVHGSHNATPAEVGMIRGAYDLVGTAKLPAPLGNIWLISTNVGEWHILTGDGFYLTGLFEADQLQVKFPPKAIPGADMSHAPCGGGGEDFGGAMAYGKDGKLYVQAGHSGFWNLEVTGLDSVRKLPGGTITISAPEVAQAEAMRENELQAVVGKHLLTVKRNAPNFTGDLAADFKGAEILSFAKTPDAAVHATATWDDQNLYLGWKVMDNTPWQNSAKVPADMYVSGDTVDFQLGTDPKADKNRGEAVAGDLRLSIGNFEGTPTAVLYRKVSATKKPQVFSSGVVHNYPMDYVDVLADARITEKTQAAGYVVEAAIPLSALGFQPSANASFRGDFGVTHGGANGLRTRLRTYWNNQHTGLVDDAVFELQMEPRNWGELQFAP